MNAISKCFSCLTAAMCILLSGFANAAAQNPNPPPLCTPDCPPPASTAWVPGVPLDMNFILCDNFQVCAVKVYWASRTACNGAYHDVQITDIEFLHPDCFINRCPGEDPEDFFHKVMKQFMEHNPMNFPPHMPNTCDDTWRVTNGGCWKYNDAGWPDNEIHPYYEPCEPNQCCFTRYEVCLVPYGGTYVREATAIGPGIPPVCTQPCFPACNTNAHSKRSLEQPESNRFPEADGGMLLLAYPNPVNGTHIELEYSAASSNPVTVEIYSVEAKNSETLVIYPNAEGNNSVRLNIAALNSGSYVINLVQDGRRIGSGKFLVTH